eukprot:1802106-Amphidinium_carterae.1
MPTPCCAHSNFWDVAAHCPGCPNSSRRWRHWLRSPSRTQEGHDGNDFMKVPAQPLQKYFPNAHSLSPIHRHSL